MKLRLPLGKDSFEKIRREDCYYADKTMLIEVLLRENSEVTLITRPRRFGKTLTMSMLDAFFNIEKDSRAIFEGLAISQHAELCEQWMNQCPVLFMTFKSVEGRSFESAYGMLKVLISDFCILHDYLCESEKINEADKACMRRLMAKEASDEEVKNSLYLLMRVMKMFYGKPVILLIDEYDVPLAKASEEGYYDEMLDMMRAMLGKALKTNEFLEFAVITGCLKIAKESIFTGINNLVSDTITGSRFDGYIGFVEEDVRRLLDGAKLTKHEEELRHWYDGYRFGSAHVYCPWDVLNHVAALQTDPSCKPQNYWGSTSHNSVIYRFISREDLDVNCKFEILMAGGSIREAVTDNLTYDTLKSSEKNLWSLLFLTGYLTQGEADETLVQNEDGNDQDMILRIPNEEVKAIFKTAIVDWFNDSMQSANRKELFDAFWNGQAETAEACISDILFTTISYYDYKESYYHAFLAGLFAGAGYIVESNYEHGTGRPDVVVKDKRNRRVLIIEIKHATGEGKLSGACEAALAQIVEKKYQKGLEKGYRTVLGYGIAFYEKECRIRKI